jgi:hypothetical protein
MPRVASAQRLKPNVVPPSASTTSHTAVVTSIPLPTCSAAELRSLTMPEWFTNSLPFVLTGLKRFCQRSGQVVAGPQL